MDKTTAQPKPTRAAVQQRGRKVTRPKRPVWPWVVLGIAVAAIVAYIGYAWYSSRPIDGVETFADLPRNHSQEVQTYAQNPPAGGIHYPAWQNCTTFSQPIRKEAGVHSLEHGASWITYRPDLPQDQIDALRELARGRPYTLLTPYPGLPSPVVVTAWGTQLKLDSATDSRLPRFLATYTQSGETPEMGAACSGGISTPGG